MARADYGHKMTDKELAQLQKRIESVYKRASEDTGSLANEYFAKLVKRDEKMRKLVEAGEVTDQEYKDWMIAQIGRGEWFNTLRDKLAERMAAADANSMEYVSDALPSIYALNRNWAAYTIEMAGNNIDFQLWNESVVKRLLVEQPDIMPYYPKLKAISRGFDLDYGKAQITKCVTAGILKGYGIPQIVKELQTAVPSMSMVSAFRAARTACTSAENAGRIDQYADAVKDGIDMEQEWMCTFDNRTRDSHRKLDGEHVPIGKKFSNGCRYPADPQGAAHEVYNCRCTIAAWFPAIENGRTDRITYSDWEKGKKPIPDTVGSEDAIGNAIRSETQQLYHKVKTESVFKPISDRLFEALVAGARAQGAVIIRGGDEAKRLLPDGARASCIGDWLIFGDEVSKTDVYEELRHFWQHRNNLYIDAPADEYDDLMEIEAKKYLIENAKRLKIPYRETEATMEELEFHENRLRKTREGKNG